MTTTKHDRRDNIHELRTSLEAEIQAVLDGNWIYFGGQYQDSEDRWGDWANDRILSLEVWTSPGIEAKRVEIMLVCGGPTTWIDFDGRYGSNGHATLHHSWGMNAKGEDCTTAEMSGELIESLLDTLGAI